MTTPHIPFNDTILARYLSGECTPDQALAVQAWLQVDMANERQLQALRAAWNLGEAFRTDRLKDGFDGRFDIDAMRRNLVARARPERTQLRDDLRFAVRAPRVGFRLAPIVASRSGWRIVAGFAVAMEMLGRLLWVPLKPARGATEMAGAGGGRKLLRSWPATRLVPHAFPRAAGFGVALGAVILLLTVAGGRALWRTYRLPPAVARRANGLAEGGAMRTYATPAGRKAVVTLADGSRVTLAPGSQLHVPADFGNGRRDVYMDGEAFFIVQHDVARPFAVHTAHAVARDIGTAFNLRAYPELPSVEVAVTEGIVALGSAQAHTAGPADSLLLRASDIGQVGADGRLTVERFANVAARTAWTKGQPIFDGPLAEVIPALARWYDLDIRLADHALATRRLTTVVHEESADAVLARVALALDLTVHRVGRVVTFTGDR